MYTYNFKKRFLYLAVGIFLFLIFFLIGTTISFDKTTATLLKEQFQKKIKNIDSTGIFINNFLISILMFIPGVGIAFGLFSGFSTGNIFMIITQDLPIQLPPLLVFLTIFGIMELISYGIAISRSYLLLIQILKRTNIIENIIHTSFEIGVVAIILFISAIIEWDLIRQSGNMNFLK
ncbi:MAG: stage II sporulation protein M [Thaumarchaeota archaeon]|nr:MAG: stage II sporulation protein M [Nitrososphaerota archaeon]TLX91230.1 MAG: stage II sporulation protein M [Nitrososphaerota archaeon]